MRNGGGNHRSGWRVTSNPLERRIERMPFASVIEQFEHLLPTGPIIVAYQTHRWKQVSTRSDLNQQYSDWGDRRNKCADVRRPAEVLAPQPTANGNNR